MTDFMMTRFICALVLATTTAGCAAFGRAPLAVTTSCSPAHAWDSALESVKHLTLRRTDQDNGVIATEWMVVPSGKKSGVFTREGNRERARFFLNLEPVQQTVTISIRQIREYFSPMGVQSQSTRWRRIPPLAEEEHHVMQRLSNHLKDRGCAILR